MPSRAVPLVNNQFYHIFNRGSEKRRIFTDGYEFNRFLKSITYYQLEGPKPKLSQFFRYKNFNMDSNKKIVDLICYCLMPNHVHFILRQTSDKGITEFMGKLANSYTKYFNTKNKRVGPLFQGEFKSLLIESDEQLLHLTRYIHLNPFVANLVLKPEDYQYYSYREYLKIDSTSMCNSSFVLNYFKSVEQYKSFVDDHSDYAKSTEEMKHQLIES